VTRTAAVLAFLAAASPAAAELSLSDRFVLAIERGSLRDVRTMIEDQDVPVEGPITYGEHSITPLHKAAERGQPEIVKYLLGKGANPNARASDDGGTALMAGVMSANDDVVRMLLAAGADVKPRDNRGNSAFSAAVFGARLEIGDQLLAKGADPNEADPSNGITPLLGAASMGGEETIRWLVEKGAKVNKVTQLEYGGSTALTTAARVGNAANVKLLLELGADPRLKMKSGATALSNAEESGDAETIALIKAALAKAPAAPAKPAVKPPVKPKS
jgi:ankyrin repeat protein